jgi:hypothetical protein
LAGSGEEERKGEVAGIAAAPGRRSRGEEEERKGEGRRLTGGAILSARGKKKKKGGWDVGCRGEWLVGRWAVGLERRGGKFFFSFLFQTLFKSIF